MSIPSNNNYQAHARENNLEKIFSEFFSLNKNIPMQPSTPWQPPTDVYETPDDIVVKMSIPGMKSDDIHVSFLEDVLTVHGLVSDATPHERICFYQVEIRYGYFERKIIIPKPVDTEKMQATYKDGFLQVVLPKARQLSSQKISVKIKFHQ
ncbi:MAG: Hsp20/alpha crystallin family protein [Candidatus Brocadia sp.]|nr:Hsp20/alpha crystallin family protein [Candidatus Brocadia sp.]MDG6026539.1 Hsp20/alpha crystallin family protein [Candidatus Brocadia sp.]